MATVVSKINSNFEKVGSIKVLSSSKTTTEENKGLIFGGFGYSADINANDGDGYSITIKVISKDGSYKISKKDLNVTKAGAKNIIIGNFTFYDFYLVSYSIDKEAESSILSLTYKDKSIFMDKVYIGLLNYDYGFSFTGTDVIKEIKPVGVVSKPQRADFEFSCPSRSKTTAYIERVLKTVETPDHRNFLEKRNISPKYLKFLNSIYFYSRYNFSTDSVNGGYIILGSEVMMEEPCGLPEVDYSFKDLLSALFYSRIPGVETLSLGDSKIYTDLRRQYKGTLRQVLDQWSSDFGFKFYFQPKITFKVKDYSNSASAGYEYTIKEGLQYLDLISSERTLDELNSLFDPANPKYSSSLQKVIANVSESATLEGTIKNSVITPVRREIRVFSNSSSVSFPKIASAIPLDFLPAYYGIKPSENDNEFKIRGTLAKYNLSLRDAYAIKGDGRAFGCTFLKRINQYISNSLNFKGFFANATPLDPSTLLDNYDIYIGDFDEGKKNAIVEFEKNVMENFYHQYFYVDANDNQLVCGPYDSFNLNFTTDPSSQRYNPTQLPFYEMIRGELVDSGGNKLNQSKNKTAAIFKANNVYAEANDLQFSAFSSGWGSATFPYTDIITKSIFWGSSKYAFLACLDKDGQSIVENYSNYGFLYLILKPKLSNFGVGTISILESYDPNFSIQVASEIQSTTKDSDSNCPKTFCEQNLVENNCISKDNQQVSSASTGFIHRLSEVVRVDASCRLILPTFSPYQYRLTRNSDSTTTFPSASFVLGEPPVYNDEDSNVLSFGTVQTNIPEVLTQATINSGVQDKIITFDSGASGNQVTVSSVSDFHNIAKRSLNNSVNTPQQKRDISLISTFVPEELKSYIFSNPILSSMNFSLGEQGFSMNFSFSSRPKFRKQADAVFLAQRFLKTY